MHTLTESEIILQKSQCIWLLCKPGVMLFLKAATPILSFIMQMPLFAFLATGLMIPSSACINWEWPGLYVESDHFRGRIGFFFKNKNWMVIGPAPSYFFCWQASSNFVHGFPHCPVKVALIICTAEVLQNRSFVLAVQTGFNWLVR